MAHGQLLHLVLLFCHFEILQGSCDELLGWDVPSSDFSITLIPSAIFLVFKRNYSLLTAFLFLCYHGSFSLK